MIDVWRRSFAVAGLAALALPTEARHALRATHIESRPRSARVPALNFSPYLRGQRPSAGIEIADEQIVRRLAPLIGYTQAIRTYGASSGLKRIAPLAQGMGFDVWAGAWISSDLAGNERELANLVAIGTDGHASVLVVGSEVLLRRDLSEAALLGYLARVRRAVPAGVAVTTAETYAVLLAQPRVLEASDVVFANAHPFWEGHAVTGATHTVESAWRRLRAAAKGKRVVISEVGWPSAGPARGAAVPSEANAARFFCEFSTWARVAAVEYAWFSAFDEAWKAGPGGEGAIGARWGLWREDGRTLKPGIEAVFDRRPSCDGIRSAPPLKPARDSIGSPQEARPR